MHLFVVSLVGGMLFFYLCYFVVSLMRRAILLFVLFSYFVVNLRRCAILLFVIIMASIAE